MNSLALLSMRVFLLHRDDAAVRHFTDHVLKLDGGVVNSEYVVQTLFHLTQDAFAGGRRNVSDRDMTGERAGFRADAPHMEIVNVVYAFYFANCGFDQRQFHATRSAFQQDVQRFAQDAETGPEDQRANAEGERGIDP